MRLRALARALSASLALLFGTLAWAEAEPTTIVVLGATGDLTGRLLTPALTDIIGELPRGSRVLGVGRPDPQLGSDGDFRAWLKDRTTRLTGKLDAAGWARLEDRLHFQALDLTSPASYAALKDRLEQLDAEDQQKGALRGPRRVIFYYAIAPSLIGPATDGLAKAGLIGPGTRNDVVPEKPLGTDGKTARAVIDKVIDAAGAEHVYFMDHYNGKPGVESLQRLRGDARFTKIWNKRYIDHIEVRALESLGAEGRGAFYDPTGATRDMVQSHLLQALSFATMGERGDVAVAKAEALESLRLRDEHRLARSIVRGQYRAGGKLGSYTAEPGVAAGSSTETYVKLRLTSAARPLKDVPITVETGKALRAKQSQVEVHFKRLPVELAAAVGLHPDEAARLRVDLASGEATLADRPLALEAAPSQRPAYATQLLRVVAREHAFFPSPREVAAAWKLIDPVERTWQKSGARGLRAYTAGGKGPAAASRLSVREVPLRRGARP